MTHEIGFPATSAEWLPRLLEIKSRAGKRPKYPLEDAEDVGDYRMAIDALFKQLET